MTRASGMGLVSFLVVVSLGASARAQPVITEQTSTAEGHWCFRVDALCWECADLQFPATLPCTASCGPNQVCIGYGQGATCVDRVPVCCDEPPCNRPPGCSATFSSCVDVGADGVVDRCIMLDGCIDTSPPELPTAVLSGADGSAALVRPSVKADSRSRPASRTHSRGQRAERTKAPSSKDSRRAGG